MNMFNLTQVIKEPTRICSTSSTGIDLILVSDSDKISQCGVIHTTFSDHSIIYCTRKLTKCYFSSHNTVTLRSAKNYNKENFQARLLCVDWTPVILSDNVNNAWVCFKHLLLSVLDSIAPVKQIRIKQRTQTWMDSDILQAISERDKAFYKYKHDKCQDNFETFKSLRNHVQQLVYKAKKDFFTNSIKQNKTDSKALWKTLKSLGLPSKKASTDSSSNICLKINDNICFEKKLIAENFNSFIHLRKLPTPPYSSLNSGVIRRSRVMKIHYRTFLANHATLDILEFLNLIYLCDFLGSRTILTLRSSTIR